MPALEAAFEGGGVHVVAVPVDDSKYKRLLGESLAQGETAGRLIDPK
ncbi:hypothetical protein HFO60_35575 [Rhizobium leguminosarum]|nr:hypothetical protein [Rhizobium leguminosarum]